MTDKSAPPKTTTPPEAAAKKASSGPPKSAPKSAAKPASPAAPARSRDDAADTSVGDTAVRPGFAERLQAKLAAGAAGLRTSPNEDGAPATASATAAKPRGPRRARLRLTRIDPWSVMKTSFLLSIAFGIVTVVAVAMIWNVLDGAGVFDSVNQTVRDVVDDQATATFDVRDYIGTDRVVGFTMLVAAVDVILLTAIATLGAFLYNMAAALLGGVEVTLAEDN